jgi:hypothetical protein
LQSERQVESLEQWLPPTSCRTKSLNQREKASTNEPTDRPGTDVMILEIFSPKIFAKISAGFFA